jgi:hypothetical protein
VDREGFGLLTVKCFISGNEGEGKGKFHTITCHEA